MMSMLTRSRAALGLAAMLAACSPDPAPTTGETSTPTEEASATEPAEADMPAARPSAKPDPRVLGLEGLGALKIGGPVPKGSGWAEEEMQISDDCRIVSSPNYPGVYAIAEGGTVRRISVGEGSDVRLVEGIGVGASEADVKKWFAGLREEGHAYVEAPAKYLTAPGADSGDPALRFEIGADRKVEYIHVGTMPTLGYVEGCA